LIGKKTLSIYRKQITHLPSGNQTDMELRNRIVRLRQQVQHLPSGNQTDMELRNRTVGLRQQIQRCHHAESQSKILRVIANTLWYVTNHTLHTYTVVCNKSYSTYIHSGM